MLEKRTPGIERNDIRIGFRACVGDQISLEIEFELPRQLVKGACVVCGNENRPELCNLIRFAA